MKKLILLFLLIGLCNAEENYTINYYVADINTYQALNQANITLINNTIIYNSTTDDYGNGYFPSVTTGYYDVQIIRSGYLEYNSNLNVQTNTTIDVYLIPISTEGIIFLTFNDITLTNHNFCLYYRDNNRLHGCYHINDTVRILNDYNYTLKLRIKPSDILTNPSTLSRYSHIYLSIILGGSIILGIIIIFIMILKKV